MTNIWTRNGASIAALRPARGDLVVITTLAGQLAALDPVADYNAAITRALRLAAHNRRAPIKVLPMTLGEALSFCGISIEDFMSDLSAEEWRDRCVAICTPALSDPDPRVQADATAVLTGLEGLPQC